MAWTVGGDSRWDSRMGAVCGFWRRECQVLEESHGTIELKLGRKQIGEGT